MIKFAGKWDNVAIKCKIDFEVFTLKKVEHQRPNQATKIGCSRLFKRKIEALTGETSPTLSTLPSVNKFNWSWSDQRSGLLVVHRNKREIKRARIQQQQIIKKSPDWNRSCCTISKDKSVSPLGGTIQHLTWSVAVYLGFVARTHGGLPGSVFIGHWGSLRIGVK